MFDFLYAHISALQSKKSNWVVHIDFQEEIDSLASNYPDRFHVYYVLNQVFK